MPAKMRPGEFIWASEEEKARVVAEAAALGRSLSNHVRIALGLDPIQQGGARKKAGRPKAVKQASGRKRGRPRKEAD